MDYLQNGIIVKDSYIIENFIAEGGLSYVYRVEDFRRGGNLALKELKEHPVPDLYQDRVTLFQNEFSAMKDFDHYNIPKVVDFFEDCGKYYIAMELIDGKTLEELACEKRDYSEQEVISYGIQLTHVFTYLHSKGIVYRDIKPSNIMLDKDGKLFLIDFGTVRVYKANKDCDTIQVGTVGYAPPEQYGYGQTDARSDVYSLGALLHELITGHSPDRKPFYFPDANTIRKDVSSAFTNVLHKATQKAQADRYQSMKEMERALQEAQEQVKTKADYPKGNIISNLFKKFIHRQN